ncbi:hypothetical protein BT67DRAFT_126418 [Trichocladium antarcticum]|uniref:Uncharacterized protein n=1 Tax=Trichocladium antarcticum TaxID=1450529 RepID=A0AAN6ZG60_9PEZI|nr:hypothetical protein BT67DRAFT_126418 [Trichocladium antarcticum]
MATSDRVDMAADEAGTPTPEGRPLPFIFPSSYAMQKQACEQRPQCCAQRGAKSIACWNRWNGLARTILVCCLSSLWSFWLLIADRRADQVARCGRKRSDVATAMAHD